eukprot:1156723-Pelagomonas_calceolata.AAC.5
MVHSSMVVATEGGQTEGEVTDSCEPALTDLQRQAHCPGFNWRTHKTAKTKKRGLAGLAVKYGVVHRGGYVMKGKLLGCMASQAELTFRFVAKKAITGAGRSCLL